MARMDWNMDGAQRAQISRRGFLALGGAAVAAFAGLGLAACSGNAQTSSSSAAGSDSASAASTSESYDPVTLKIAYMPTLASASAIFIGIDQGYFKEVGITVEPQQFQKGPAEITAMQSGDIDISEIGHGATSLAIKGQAKVIALDGLSKADAVVANKAKGISKPEDLKGKTVGVSSGTSSQIILTYVLKKAGLTVNDIKTVEMDVAGMTTAIVAGQIDAAATWSPNTITIKKQLGDNYVELGTNKDFVDQVSFPSSFVVTPDYAEKNQGVLERFGKALLKAQEYRAKNIDEVAKAVAKDINVDEATFEQSTGEGDWDAPVDAKGDVDAITKIYEAQQKAFIDGGQLKETVPVKNYVDLDLIEKYSK